MKATMNKRIETNILLSNAMILNVNNIEAKPLINRCCVNEVINGYCTEAFKTCPFLHKNGFLNFYTKIFEKFDIPVLDDDEYLELCKKFSKTEDVNEKRLLGLEVEKQCLQLYNKQASIYWIDHKGVSKRPWFNIALHRFSGSILYFKHWPPVSNNN